MDRTSELALIDELLALKASKSTFLDQAVARNPVDHYTRAERFERERDALFRRLPNAAAHVSELAGPGAFLRREVGGSPVLITRDKAGTAHAFLNVCRHRGTRLVDDASGRRHRFSCPYHAWTYASTGELIAAPHFEEGFEGVDTSALGLTRLSCQERFGFVWVAATPDQSVDIDGFFAGVAADLEALGLADMRIAADDTQMRRANWKILVEGGIEAYHFRVAHRGTIGPHFEDNLSTYRGFGPHLRSVLPRTSMASLTDDARAQWRLRDHANVLYSLFPTSQLLVMQDHVVWVRLEPLAADATRLRISTLAPRAEPEGDLRDDAHWRRNHLITTTTLNEDFEIGESMQASAGSGANTHMLFGRFEGALDQFNRTVEAYLTG